MSRKSLPRLCKQPSKKSDISMENIMNWDTKLHIGSIIKISYETQCGQMKYPYLLKLEHHPLPQKIMNVGSMPIEDYNHCSCGNFMHLDIQSFMETLKYVRPIGYTDGPIIIKQLETIVVQAQSQSDEMVNKLRLMQHLAVIQNEELKVKSFLLYRYPL